MAITNEQFGAANRRGELKLTDGPVARAARYDVKPFSSINCAW